MYKAWLVAVIVVSSLLQPKVRQLPDRIIVRTPTFEIVSIMHPGEAIYLCYANLDFVSGDVLYVSCKPAVPEPEMLWGGRNESVKSSALKSTDGKAALASASSMMR